MKDQRTRRGGRGGRRQPPPDATGQYGDYLARLREEGTVVTARMRDGNAFTGAVEYYDSAVVKIVPAEGPTVLLRVDDIRLLEECDD